MYVCKQRPYYWLLGMNRGAEGGSVVCESPIYHSFLGKYPPVFYKFQLSGKSVLNISYPINFSHKYPVSHYFFTLID